MYAIYFYAFSVFAENAVAFARHTRLVEDGLCLSERGHRPRALQVCHTLVHVVVRDEEDDHAVRHYFRQLNKLFAQLVELDA